MHAWLIEHVYKEREKESSKQNNVIQLELPLSEDCEPRKDPELKVETNRGIFVIDMGISDDEKES